MTAAKLSGATEIELAPACEELDEGLVIAGALAAEADRPSNGPGARDEDLDAEPYPD